MTLKMQHLITVLTFRFLARLLQRPWQNPCWQKYPLSWWTSSTPWSWSRQTPPVLHQTLREQPDPTEKRAGALQQQITASSITLTLSPPREITRSYIHLLFFFFFYSFRVTFLIHLSVLREWNTGNNLSYLCLEVWGLHLYGNNCTFSSIIMLIYIF